MRSIIIVLGLILLAGCANNRIRFVKASAHQTVVENNEKESKASHRDEVNVRTKSFTREAEASVDKPILSEQDQSRQTFDSETAIKRTEAADLPEPQDSVLILESEYKYMLAKDAEKDARNAKRWFILSLVMMILPVTALFSFIPYIVGLVFIRKSNNSDFITLEGQRHARIANVMKWVITVLLAIAVIALGIVVAIFIL